MHDFDRVIQVVHTSHRVCVDTKMPVDFASYLLSASPPGFDLHYTLRDSFGLNNGPAKRHNSHLLPLRSIMVTATETVREENNICPVKTVAPTTLTNKSFSDSNIDTICDKVRTVKINESKSAPSRLHHCSPAKNNVNKTGKGCLLNTTQNRTLKKVTFADESGLAIAAVRIITESPDTPPQLRPEILSSLTRGASAGVTVTPPLTLNFEQPASDYVAFREKIDRNCVSLENVILKDYNVLGTIKVKNVSFNKTVKVRCTYDSWESHVDVSANYVPTNGIHTGSNSFDTFSFEISIPPNFNMHKKIQFAVFYEVDNDTFWDNNNGLNYEVVSAEWKAAQEEQKNRSHISQEPAVFDQNHFSDCWTEFSSWSNIDNSVPYY